MRTGRGCAPKEPGGGVSGRGQEEDSWAGVWRSQMKQGSEGGGPIAVEHCKAFGRGLNVVCSMADTKCGRYNLRATSSR